MTVNLALALNLLDLVDLVPLVCGSKESARCLCLNGRYESTHE